MAPIKPEAALDKAKKMVSVSRVDSAIEILIECMKAQKKQKSWTKKHEELMMLLADLCVISRKSLQFKEVIHQYKNMTAQVNPKSLEDVVRTYLSLAKQRTEKAQEEAQIIPDDIEDLETLEAPESLILKVVNAEVEQDRQDRTVLTPWLKFLWESFRQCLELLRNNPRFEKMYHEIVADAAEFCRRYDRKAEFKKLSEILRSHMAKLQNTLVMPGSVAANAISLTAESWALHHDTRLRLLDQALAFELYSEAYKAVEDLYNLLINTNNASVKPRIYATYYAKTARVFFESGLSYLFHAAALHKLFFFSKENKKHLSAAEIESLASQLVIATLAVPLPFIRETVDPLLESGEITNPQKLKQLSMLLKLPSPPTRASLISDINAWRIYDLVNPALAKLFLLLENDFKPLSMAAETEEILQWIDSHKEFHIYSQLIRDAIASKILIQVGKVYKSIKLEKLEKLCPFVSRLELLSIVTNLIRNLELPIQIDYRESLLTFDVYTDIGIGQRNDADLVSEDVNSMSTLSRQINRFALAMYQAVTHTGESSCTRDTVKQWIRSSYISTMLESHAQMMRRKEIIEQRKEEIEQFEEEQTLTMNKHIRQQEERRRKEEDSKLKEEREMQHIKQLLQNKEKGEKKKMEIRMNYLNSTEAGKEVLKNYSIEQLEKMKDEEVAKLQIDTRIQMRLEEHSRLSKLEKKVDYFQRAIHQEEIPYIKEMQHNSYQSIYDLFNTYQEKRKVRARENHCVRLANRDLCKSIKCDVDNLIAEIEKVCQQDYQKAMNAYHEECEQIKEDFREKIIEHYREMEVKEKEEREAKLLEEAKEEEAWRKASDAQATEKKEEARKKVTESQATEKKVYIPPHLRKKQAQASQKKVIDTDGWQQAGKK